MTGHLPLGPTAPNGHVVLALPAAAEAPSPSVATPIQEPLRLAGTSRHPALRRAWEACTRVLGLLWTVAWNLILLPLRLGRKLLEDVAAVAMHGVFGLLEFVGAAVFLAIGLGMIAVEQVPENVLVAMTFEKLLPESRGYLVDVFSPAALLGGWLPWLEEVPAAAVVALVFSLFSLASGVCFFAGLRAWMNARQAASAAVQEPLMLGTQTATAAPPPATHVGGHGLTFLILGGVATAIFMVMEAAGFSLVMHPGWLGILWALALSFGRLVIGLLGHWVVSRFTQHVGALYQHVVGFLGGLFHVLPDLVQEAIRLLEHLTGD